MERNPFAINFGMVPKQYISRDILIDEITDELKSEFVQNPCFMLTGTRGSGRNDCLSQWMKCQIPPT